MERERISKCDNVISARPSRGQGVIPISYEQDPAYFNVVAPASFSRRPACAFQGVRRPDRRGRPCRGEEMARVV